MHFKLTGGPHRIGWGAAWGVGVWVVGGNKKEQQKRKKGPVQKHARCLTRWVSGVFLLLFFFSPYVCQFGF